AEMPPEGQIVKLPCRASVPPSQHHTAACGNRLSSRDRMSASQPAHVALLRTNAVAAALGAVVRIQRVAGPAHLVKAVLQAPRERRAWNARFWTTFAPAFGIV